MSCNSIIPDSEVSAIYTNVDADYSIDVVKNECRNAATSKYVHLEVSKGNEILLDKPIIWDFLKESRCWKSGTYGKVAKFEQITIASKFKDLKIATKFDESGIVILRRNQFKEIHITAIHDGILVWSKLFYKFVYREDEDKIIGLFQKYLFHIHGMNSVERSNILMKIKAVNEIPKRIARPTDKIKFVDWLENEIKEKKISLMLKLYKDLS